MAESLIYSVGTQVVIQKDTYHLNQRVAHPAGSVGVVVRSPIDRTHTYRVKFNDGFEAAVHHDQLISLSEFKRERIGEALRDCRSSRKATIDQIWQAAKVYRIANVMRPYLEAAS